MAVTTAFTQIFKGSFSSLAEKGANLALHLFTFNILFWSFPPFPCYPAPYKSYVNVASVCEVHSLSNLIHVCFRFHAT